MMIFTHAAEDSQSINSHKNNEKSTSQTDAK